MPYRPSQKLNLSLTPRAFWAWAAALTLLRLAVTAFQQGYTWVGGAPLDDELMFRAANAITAGQWLGTYDYLTLSKAMFFPVWLALLHALHLPYLTAGAALWCAAAGLAAAALRPLWAAATAGHGPHADAGAVRGACVSALVLGGVHAARLPGQYLPGAVPACVRGLCGGAAARGAEPRGANRNKAPAPVAVAAGGRGGAGGRVS